MMRVVLFLALWALACAVWHFRPATPALVGSRERGAVVVSCEDAVQTWELGFLGVKRLQMFDQVLFLCALSKHVPVLLDLVAPPSDLVDQLVESFGIGEVGWK